MASKWLLKQTIWIFDEMFGAGEMESKRPKTFAASSYAFINAGNLPLRLSRLLSSF